MKPTVFVVDDDRAVRQGLDWLLESVRLPVETYESAQEFLEALDPSRSGCLVLDVRMPRMSGLELLERLAARAVPLPVIIITGHADVPMAVRAMKAGAFDFIEKPFSDQVLLEAIQRALDRDARARDQHTRRQELSRRLAELTPRERDVLDRMVAGQPNKAIAAQLDVTERTVEAHRSRIMDKMKAQSLAELVRFVVEVETCPDR